MTEKFSARAAMLGTVLFTLSFTLHGLLRPDYKPMQRYVSELAIGPTGWIQRISFMLLGVAVALFSRGLRAAFPMGKASRTAPVIFMIIGVSYLLSGLFVTDPQAMFDNQQTWHGVVHGIAGALVFSLSAAGCFVLWRRFRVDEKWKSLSLFSLIAGMVMTVSIGLMKYGQLQTGWAQDWAGVIQRGCLIVSYAWIFMAALKLEQLRD